MTQDLLQREAPASGMTAASHKKVCLLLEGTYPYVFGGVSAWVDQMMRAMPEREFVITFIGSRKNLCGQTKYAIPENLTAIHEIYLHDQGQSRVRFSRGARARAREVIDAVRDHFAGKGSALRMMDCFCSAASACSLRDFWEMPETWELLQDLYMARAPACAFKEFYWNVWNFAVHLWALLGEADRVPRHRSTTLPAPAMLACSGHF